jgi:hypothetical protein
MQPLVDYVLPLPRLILLVYSLINFRAELRKNAFLLFVGLAVLILSISNNINNAFTVVNNSIRVSTLSHLRDSLQVNNDSLQKALIFYRGK